MNCVPSRWLSSPSNQRPPADVLMWWNWVSPMPAANCTPTRKTTSLLLGTNLKNQPCQRLWPRKCVRTIFKAQIASRISYMERCSSSGSSSEAARNKKGSYTMKNVTTTTLRVGTPSLIPECVFRRKQNIQRSERIELVDRAPQGISPRKQYMTAPARPARTPFPWESSSQPCCARRTTWNL